MATKISGSVTVFNCHSTICPENTDWRSERGTACSITQEVHTLATSVASGAMYNAPSANTVKHVAASGKATCTCDIMPQPVAVSHVLRNTLFLTTGKGKSKLTAEASTDLFLQWVQVEHPVSGTQCKKGFWENLNRSLFEVASSGIGGGKAGRQWAGGCWVRRCGSSTLWRGCTTRPDAWGVGTGWSWAGRPKQRRTCECVSPSSSSVGSKGYVQSRLHGGSFFDQEIVALHDGCSAPKRQEVVGNKSCCCSTHVMSQEDMYNLLTTKWLEPELNPDGSRATFETIIDDH